ncbi:MAG TPA: type II toxin-antitoxin system RelE/ParE family toxin [Chloroflexota bacterium]|nr:type II toxin-antitoxin system RelE/ParE family toxin [Chloroflexota bacterium]
MQRVTAWWAANRPAAPDAVSVAIDREVERIQNHPGIGAPVSRTRLTGVRRVHLKRIHYYLYYRVEQDDIEILALWHTSRGTGPPI